MTHPLQWFEDREMDTILMTTPEGKEVEAVISDKNEAKYYFDLQFKDEPFTFKAKLRIHKAPPAGCTSCEG